MIILGHPDIPFEPLYYVESVDEIAQTPAGATLWLGPYAQSLPLAHHCLQNALPYGVMAETLREALLANALKARYILAALPLAEEVQKAAETYLFDAKILVPIHDDDEIEPIARRGIDGVIFQGAITLPGSR